MSYNYNISASSLNELTINACQTVLNYGNRLISRNGYCQEITDSELYLDDPYRRHLYLDGRKSNIFATIAETIWVLSGSDRIDPYLSFFIPRAKDYSDDGITWRGAYGERLYEGNQLEGIIEAFKDDGKLTRRAVAAIWQPHKDSAESIRLKYNIERTKDLCCSNFLNYWIRDNKLNSKLSIRSNDVIFGMSHINVFEFTFLQEIILRLLQAMNPAEFNDVELGYYHHSVISLHIYDTTVEQANAIVNSSHNSKQPYYSNMQMSLGSSFRADDLESFFFDLYYNLSDYITGTVMSHDTISETFEKYKVPKNNNLLYGYCLLVREYIKHKTGCPTSYDTVREYISEDLHQAVMFNKFTPAHWKLQEVTTNGN